MLISVYIYISNVSSKSRVESVNVIGVNKVSIADSEAFPVEYATCQIWCFSHGDVWSLVAPLSDQILRNEFNTTDLPDSWVGITDYVITIVNFL